MRIKVCHMCSKKTYLKGCQMIKKDEPEKVKKVEV